MIRNIIYLDEPKFFSLSSQVFKGLTEFLLNEKSEGTEKTEAQKGPVASGRALADAMKSSETLTERRVLHDYAFSLFEQELPTHGLADIRLDTASDAARQLVEQNSFIRIKAPATIMDMAKLDSIFKEFNQLGEAVAYVTQADDFRAAIAKKTGKPAASISPDKILSLVREAVRGTSLYQDPKFLEYLSKLANFGYSGQFEIRQSVNGLIYSSILKREYLRESENLMTKKYSRLTEKEFVVLGLITQKSGTAKVPENVVENGGNMKESMMEMFNHIAELESSLSGKSTNEVVLDPIAVYVAL